MGAFAASKAMFFVFWVLFLSKSFELYYFSTYNVEILRKNSTNIKCFYVKFGVF